MKISLNYLKQFIDFDLPDINDLADVIGARLGALEDNPVNLRDLYKDVVIVKVVECSPMEGTDHLNLCLIDDGQKVKNVERNDQGLISVVCGAPNVESGIMAAWLPPGSVVPVTYSEEKLVLEARPIRGQVSNGMLASPKELALSDDHEGILIVDAQTNPGDSFLEVYQLDDHVIDIENKMFTHRPDCFGLIGVAREVSGILGHPFKSPDWYLKEPKLDLASGVDIKVQNEIPNLTPRFSVVVIDGIEIKPSPSAIQSYLTRMGVRPINNIVDLTNIVMLETSQPLHAYDYHKLQKLGGDNLTMSVRLPKPNETLTLLNGKEVKPTPESIGIAIADNLIGLGGVMGGQNTEVDDSTTAIVIEAACFDMYTIRRTSMELGIFSEAVTRFTKGQSPLQTTRVLNYALTRLKELLPESKVMSSIVDDVHVPEDVLKSDSIHSPVTVTTSFINERLGTDLDVSRMATLLTNVEFQVEVKDEELTVSAPFWRTDIEIREDIVEEVGRLYGYENIQPVPLKRSVSATPKNKQLETKAEIRQLLASGGANELLTYSFVSKRLVESANQSVDKAYELANSLSPELNYYRLSILPSLLSKVNTNIKAGFDSFALFEIGAYHVQGINKDNEPELPAELSSLALVYASKNPSSGAAYFKAKEYLSYLAYKLNISGISFEPLNKVQKLADNLIELAKPFDINRSALVRSGDSQWGIVGEFKANVLSALKLTKYSAGFEVDTNLFMSSNEDGLYSALSKYPSVKQDITLSVPVDHSYSEVYGFLVEQLGGLVSKTQDFAFTPVSIFRPKDDSEHVNYTFHLVIADYDRTLKDIEVNELLGKLSDLAKDKLGAARV